MTTYQLISIIATGIFLLIAIFGVYLKMQVEITRIKMQIKAIEKDLLQKEIATLLAEKINREDHEKILNKIDGIKEILMKMKE